ncbi:uncharacterized protein C15orf39 homolog [Melopsittacus undulatus]|uniref:uncharacterized protein C15orf39 homolog n=1 Tax=Melopsittacus undulatus TaxID=13146 RepID=UPI00146DBB9B|nr:uncharacterized protein C15orf39 homolog [Melopsittacus undulatus]
MSSKRSMEPLDPMIFAKLPRLEQDPGPSLPTGPCKLSPQNHFNYKGSYFACTLQGPDGSRLPYMHQSPAPPHPHYGTGAGSQPVPVEGPGEHCPPHPPESMGPRLQPPLSAEVGRDRLMPELVMAREKWGNVGPGNPFPVRYPAMVSRAPPLAVPRPMYRAPAYFMDLRVAPPLQQRPGNVDWALPPDSRPFHPGELRRGPHIDPNLPPLPPRMALPPREVGSPAALSSYYAAFQQYQSPPQCLLDDSPPRQRKAPEMHRLSPDPWHTLCPRTTSPVYPEKPPEHYPSFHKAPLLFPPPPPHMEAQPCAYRGIGFEGSREPYPGTYLKPQAPWRVFPNPMDTYVPRAASAVASPPSKAAVLPRDVNPSRQEEYVPSSSFTFSPSGTAVSSTSRGHMEPGCEQHQAEGPHRPVVVRQISAFQSACTQEVPGGSGGIPEAFPKGGRCLGKQEPTNPERTASSAPPKASCEGPPALITIEEGDTCKVKDAAKDLISPPPASLPEGPEDPRDSKVPPPSPPMPVIKKVFSLASYGEFLDDAKSSDPFCREHLWEDTGGSPVQEHRESGRRGVPGEPEPVRQGRGSEEGALDLRVKKRGGEARESPVVLNGGERKEEENSAERKAGVGGGTQLMMKPWLVRVIWTKRHIQRTASFVVLHSSAALSTIPAPSSTIPAPSSTIPALPSTIPAPSSTIPAPSSTIPALPSTIPALPSTIPAPSSTIPAPSSTIPALPSTIPAPSSTIPAPSSTIPAPSSTITMPALSSTIPTPPSTIPAPSGTIAALSSTIPAPSSTIPTLTSTIPALSSIIPSPFRTTPAPSSTIPTLSRTIPALFSTIPAISSIIPAPSSPIPALSSTIPAPSRTIPALCSTIPALPSTIPALSGIIPTLSSIIPALPSTIPVLSSTIPALSSIIPAPSSTIPALSSTIPALSSTIPAPSSTIPTLSSTVPAPSSTIPTLSSTIPAPSSTIPSPPSSPQCSPALPPAPCSLSPSASPQPEPPLSVPGEEAVPLPSSGAPFTALHTSLCDLLSCSVARSSPQLLREWLQKAEPAEEKGEMMPKSPLEARNSSRVPEHHKGAKGKEVWLAFKDVPALLANLLSQLETFTFTCKCPFPHVVRAGAIFIPIHVVKEKLFPKLPGVSVDQVLQEHKVELRPTTLSEERHLRDLELKSCTSRMLKLLALKQLPDIYPDLLHLHWHHSIKQQLGSSSKAGKNPSK